MYIGCINETSNPSIFTNLFLTAYLRNDLIVEVKLFLYMPHPNSIFGFVLELPITFNDMIIAGSVPFMQIQKGMFPCGMHFWGSMNR